MMPVRAALFALLVAAVPAVPAAAQGRWKAIGTTGVGNPVQVDPKSIVRDSGLVTATLRAVFVKPVKVPTGELKSSRTIATFDCAKRMVQVRENWYYFDLAGTKVYEHRKPQVPGFASIIRGALPDVAHAWLCAAK